MGMRLKKIAAANIGKALKEIKERNTVAKENARKKSFSKQRIQGRRVRGAKA